VLGVGWHSVTSVVEVHPCGQDILQRLVVQSFGQMPSCSAVDFKQLAEQHIALGQQPRGGQSSPSLVGAQRKTPGTDRQGAGQAPQQRTTWRGNGD
jgi:hypothetical protein